MLDIASELEFIQHLEFQPPCEWTADGYSPECTAPAEWILLYVPCQCRQLVSFYCNYHKEWTVKIMKNSRLWCATCQAELDLISVERI